MQTSSTDATLLLLCFLHSSLLARAPECNGNATAVTEKKSEPIHTRCWKLNDLSAIKLNASEGFIPVNLNADVAKLPFYICICVSTCRMSG